MEWFRAHRLAVVVVTASPLPIAAQISVGPNVHVSKGYPADAHFELLANADPKDPSRLIACSAIFPRNGASSTIVYSSFDGGKTWSPTLGPAKLETSGDPVCTYGPNGEAYYVTLKSVDDRGRTLVYRSPDGGKTWPEPLALIGTDREFVIADNTNSKYRGSVYVNGTGSVRGISPLGPGVDRDWVTDLTVIYSRDGVHYSVSKRAEVGNRYVLGMGNSVVLSDGTLLFTFGEIVNYSSGTGPIARPVPGQPNAILQVISSEDGGETLNTAVKISDFYMDWPPFTTSVNPYLAVDLSEGPFKDRVYCVWPDRRSGRLEIYVSHSTDKGKTWSAPVIINDDRPWPSADGPDNLMPVIQVNRSGVVGVVWQDRRDNPDNLGYWVRFTASTDGGETWAPSVRVSEKPNAVAIRDETAVAGSPGTAAPGARTTPTPASGPVRPLSIGVSYQPFAFSGGHYAGMAVGATGIFHPVWIDNRSGVAQMWTAPVTVGGAAIKHGSGDLGSLIDVSNRVRLELSQVSFNKATGALTMTGTLRNLSKDTLRGPVKARVVDVRSDLGTPTFENPGPAIRGAGALWDLSAMLQGGVLLPDSVSSPRPFTFRVTDQRPLRQGDQLRLRLIDVDLRVFVTQVSESAKTPAKEPQ